MDNLTHTLIGVAVAKAGLAKRFGKGTTWILAVASNLPDLDVLLLFFGIRDSFLLRRTLTHSIVGVPIIALAASLIFSRFTRTLTTGTVVGLVFLAMGLHILFDLMNSYGVVLFYPISLARFELAWIFIIDLVIWGLLILPFGVERFSFFQAPEMRVRLWQGVVALLTLYVLMCGACRWRAIALLKTEMRARHDTGRDPYVFPEALGCHRFRGVFKEGSTVYLYRIRIFSGEVQEVNVYPSAQDDPRIQPLLKTPRLERLMSFFKCPVFRWVDDQHVEVFDLRFLSTVLRMRNSAFSFVFEVPPSYTQTQ
jgi:inner membrane protein